MYNARTPEAFPRKDTPQTLHAGGRMCIWPDAHNLNQPHAIVLADAHFARIQYNV